MWRLLLCFFLVGYGWALTPHKQLTQYVHRHWSSSDGLPQQSIFSITQADDDTLLLATQDGLFRFDGRRFTALFPDTRANPVDDRAGVTLLKDRDGAYWLGTQGYGVLRFTATDAQQFNTDHGLPGNIVAEIIQDRAGTVWVATMAGLCRFRDGRPTRVQLAESGYDRQPDPNQSDPVQALLEDSQGRIWVGGQDGSLRRFQADRPEAVQRLPAFTQAAITELYQDRTGTIWVGTAGAGLFRLGHDAVRAVSATLHGAMIEDLLEDADGVLWVATQQGLRRLVDGLLIDETPFLADAVLVKLFRDRDGNLWLGSKMDGLHLVRNGPVTPWSQAEGLSDGKTWSAFAGRDGSIWIGTERGGVNRIHNGTVTTLTRQDGLPSDTVYITYEDERQVLWIGTNKGVATYAHGKVAVYDSAGGLSNNVVRALEGDGEGGAWVGTEHGGLNHIRADGTITVIPPQTGFPHGFVSAIVAQPGAGLWVASFFGGLSLFDGQGFVRFSAAEGLAEDHILSLTAGADGALWIATVGGGIARYHNGSFRSFTQADGLGDNIFFRILEDRHGRLWMSGNRGIFRIARNELEAYWSGQSQKVPCTHFGREDGMRAVECNAGGALSGAVDSQGRLWFPTLDGVVAIDAKPGATPLRPLSIHMERVLLDGKPVTQGVLPAGSQRLELHFNAPVYYKAQETTYTYRLEGYDRDWVTAGATPFATYTNLPPGDYTFTVRAQHQGTSSVMPATFRFQQEPFFYQTTWFLPVCILAGLALGALLFQWRVRHLRRRKQELEQLVDHRTVELKQAYRALEAAQAQLVETAHKIGMAEIAGNVLHNVGNTLNSARVSIEEIAGRVRSLPDEKIARLLGLLDEHENDLGRFLTQDQKGRKIPEYLRALGVQMNLTRHELESEIEQLNTLAERMNRFIRDQDAYVGFAGLFEAVDLGALLVEVVQQKRESLNIDGITLQYQATPDLPQVKAQKYKLVQVLKTLIDYARESPADQGPRQCRLTTGTTDDRVFVALHFTGAPFTADERQRLFNQGYFQGKLDLHQTATWLHEMSATIHIPATTQDQTFRIDFPRASADE